MEGSAPIKPPFSGACMCKDSPAQSPSTTSFLPPILTIPRSEFINSLCSVLGKRGSIVVYYQPFEEQRLSDVAAWLPEFSGRIKNIQRRLYDLLPVVRNHVYHPQFAGSYSLKYVLPALIPKLTYAGMTVADGRQAGIAWESLVRGGLDRIEREKTRQALLDYCRLDTLAMVRLVEKLRLVSLSH